MPLRLSTGDPDFARRFDGLVHSKRESEADVGDAARAILDDVAARGDAALVEYTRRFDRFDPVATGLAITEGEIDAAVGRVPADTLAALALAAARIEAFHARQLPEGFEYVDGEGVRLGLRWTAMDAVGLYVPGGKAAYPSSVLMNAIQARVAGVARRVMVVPTPDGVLNDLVLAAARLAGLTELWRVGGAQAIGALAYGT